MAEYIEREAALEDAKKSHLHNVEKEQEKQTSAPTAGLRWRKADV